MRINMNKPENKPQGDNDLLKDQLAQEGIEVDYSSPSAIRRNENYRKDLAEEDGKKDASWKAASSPESAIQAEDNDYYNGMSQ